MTDLLPHVIYPHGPLLDLLPTRAGFYGSRRVYAVEFTGGVVKVGISRAIRGRIDSVVKDGAALGLAPHRFFVTPDYANAHIVERDVLAALRVVGRPTETPADFPAASEWTTGASLELALTIARQWVSVLTSHSTGRSIALRCEDIEAKRAAEAHLSIEEVRS